MVMMMMLPSCHSLATVPLRVLSFLESGEVSYETAWEWQKSLMNLHILQQDANMQQQYRSGGTILLLEHKSVYTLGTGTKEGSGPFSSVAADGSRLSFETFRVERAGEATYHGPGQLVVYPIIDLNYFDRDINKYLRLLEQAAMDTFSSLGIPEAGRIEGLTGVWVGDKKLAAIGIKLRRWVSMHGVSINVDPDMRYFNNIVPCGIADKQVGSITMLTNKKHSMRHVADIFLNHFASHLQAEFFEHLRGEEAEREMNAIYKQHKQEED